MFKMFCAHTDEKTEPREVPFYMVVGCVFLIFTGWLGGTDRGHMGPTGFGKSRGNYVVSSLLSTPVPQKSLKSLPIYIKIYNLKNV